MYTLGAFITVDFSFYNTIAEAFWEEEEKNIAGKGTVAMFVVD